jgi:alpha-tubulin suppressor-like RCC1 family protein
MGHNLYGQLGDGTSSNRPIPILIVPSGVVAVAAGQYFSAFIKSYGSIWGMGANGGGQLGVATNANLYSPVAIIAASPDCHPF